MVKKKTDKKIVDETIEIYKTYSVARETWAQHAQEDLEFKLGKQWTDEQVAKLEVRGQAPIVVNRIYPAVEAAKAMLTSRNPSFRVSPREDSDNQVAKAISALLEYIWQISEGNAEMKIAIDDYYTMGLGLMLAYQDSMADMGKGEVKIRNIDPLDWYPDPNSRHRFCDDAENLVISRLYTKDQAIKLEPFYKKEILKAESDVFSDRPETSRTDSGETTFPEDAATKTKYTFGEGDEYIRRYNRYTKIIVYRFRIFEVFSGKEDLYTQSQYDEYAAKKAWNIQGQIITDEATAQQAIQRLQQQYQQAMQMGQGEITEPQIQELTIASLIKEGYINVVVVPVWRVKQLVVMGNKLLYQRILPIENYPLIPFMNQHTRTPYPISDVRLVKNLQEYINKIRSLIIAHATTSTNTKILIPEGSVDLKEFEEKWAQPGVAITYDPTDGPPIPVQPIPLPNELYKNELDAKNDIDHQLGLYELMMGNSQVAPQTYKATISIDEFGQRKIRSKLADIEGGLKRLGEVVIPLMQQLYSTEKTIRLLKPNNSMSEYMINKRMYDDKGVVAGVINNIAVGKYDVIVVSGSTLPTNRYAELEIYMDAYEKQIIDRVEVLKKTEIFDIEGVMQRTDLVAQLQAQLKEYEEAMKQLKGDLQTRERETFHAKQALEVEKFKSQLGKTSSKAEAAAKVFDARLSDTLSDATEQTKEIETIRKDLLNQEKSLRKERGKTKK